MVAITHETAAGLSRRCATDDVTMGRVLAGLCRAIAHEAITDELYDDLEAVLGEHANPAPGEVPAITKRLRDAATRLVEITPYLVTPYPLDEIRSVIDMSAEHPLPDGARSHLVRFAMGILTLLDLMGDAAS
jgi:hypothetical protein